MTPGIEHLLSTYGYWLMAFGALIEGETFLIAGGIAAHEGYFHLGGLILLAVVGSTFHDCFFFFLGRFGGERFIHKKPQLYEKAERILDLFEKYGVWLIIGLRFAYGLRTMIPMVFGISHISNTKFIFYDTIGGILWACVFILGGYFFGAVLDHFMTQFDEYSADLFYGLAVLLVLAVIAGAGYWFYRARKRNALEVRLQAEIAARGPIPFIDYMARCLSEYYSHLRQIGKAGDFVTAPELGPYLADALAHALALHLADYPVIVELGAGTGQLAFDLLQKLADLNALPEAYFIQETSPSLREVQAQKLSALPQKITQIVSWKKPDKINGILIANELFDALPVERFIQTESGKKRLGVDWQNNQFVEVILDETVDFNPSGIEFEQGYRSEYCPGLGAFLDTILPVFESGLAFIIDYGYERPDYYAAHRSNGTLQAYSQHREVSPFENPGCVDLTAHVDFTTLAELMIAHGWQIDFLKPQNQFLLEQKLLERYSLSAEHYALERLLDPRLMGEVFKIMRVSLN